MASYFVSETGQVLEAAKRAAVDAVAAYTHVTPYVIGVAVQAAAHVLRTGSGSPVEPVANVAPTSSAPTNAAGSRTIDVTAVEVDTYRRALERAVRAAEATHRDRHGAAECLLCDALRELDGIVERPTVRRHRAA